MSFHRPSPSLFKESAAALSLAALLGAAVFFASHISKRGDAPRGKEQGPTTRRVESPPVSGSAVAISGEPSPPAADPVGGENETARMLRTMAAHDPKGALGAALEESDEERRSELLQAVLRGWAGMDVEAAGDWARSQDFMDHGLAMAAVFNGAVRQPSDAIHYASMLCAEDPRRARDYGVYLIFSLGQAGHHEKAAAYAAKGDPAHAGEWLNAAYNHWGRQAPELALASAVKINAATRRTAFYAVISGWAQTNPRALAVNAVNFPAGGEKDYSLIVALRSWIGRDPGAAADWIEAHRSVVEGIPGLETILED